jgi:TetR/AcrR family transcriptional regulator, tetracycline repressor protein
MMTAKEAAMTARLSRGRPAQISRDEIVSVARGLPRDELTMKAVADALGVSRKALHYHVGDRESLLNLVVVDHFEAQLAGVSLPAHSDWQVVLRAYMHALRDGLVHVGVPGAYIDLGGLSGAKALQLAERVIQTLFEAGFDDRLARRAITMAANLAMAYANIDLLTAQNNGVYPHLSATSQALHDDDPAFPGVRRVLDDARAAGPGDPDQFQFAVDMTIRGLEQALTDQT